MSKWLVYDAKNQLHTIEAESMQKAGNAVDFYNKPEPGKFLSTYVASFTGPVSVTPVKGTTFVSFKVNGHPSDVLRKLKEIESGKNPYFYKMQDLNVVEV